MPSTVAASTSVRRPGSSSSSALGLRLSSGGTTTPRRSSSLRKEKGSGVKTLGIGIGKGLTGKPKANTRSSVSASTLTFEEPESTVFIDREMLKNHQDTVPSRRPVRIDQDGPWNVSVAESPHDSRSYSLYIKTSTHNLTLTRTAMEIIELDHKLHDSVVSTSKLPTLPIDPASVPAVPKRKSAFLNTLSRLASPTSSRRSAANANGGTSSSSPTPAVSPSVEQRDDPFVSFTASSALLNASLPAPSAISTALAAYFTTLSNLQPVRQSRAWKRFVRVRTDDLESTRVERAIKRVRSDLAAHVGSQREKKERGRMNRLIDSLTTTDREEHDDEKEQDPEQELKEEEVITEDQDKGKELPDVPESQPKLATDSEPGSPVGVTASTDEPVPLFGPEDESKPEPVSPSTTKPTGVVIDLTSLATPRASEDDPRTPSASTPTSEPPSRTVPRSQSADPDRRMSRAYHTSVSATEGNFSSSQTETGDESSSISTAARSVGKSTRKKRKEALSASGSASTSTKDLAAGRKKSLRKVTVTDFEMLRVLGKGCAGKVLLVRHKASNDLYAMKAITKRHVLAHQELQHTLTEQAVLKRMAANVDENGNTNPSSSASVSGLKDGKDGATGTGGVKDPFVVKLWWSFHDKENLFLVMDFHPGGDLATQLARWGRLGRDRARFYAAEIVEGVEGLHAAGVIYRDLKPENILIGADGHIVLTDFGLSKEFPRRRDAGAGMAPSSGTAPTTPNGSVSTLAPWMKDNSDIGGAATTTDMTTTFCGTAEYLAPEVIQALPYSYEIDWWSFGTMLYEMLTGITPFWANNHSDMYVRVLQDELQFPDDRAMDQDTKSLIRGLLQRNPALRICEPRIKRHPYFSMIDWSHVFYKRYIPPYIPPIDPSNASDTQNFDDTFLDMEPVLDDLNDNEEENEVGNNTDTDQDQDQDNTDTDRTDGEETNTTPSQSRSSSIHPSSARASRVEKDGQEGGDDDSVDLFDGYSFKGRHSVLIDDEDQDEEGSEEEGTDEEEDGEGDGEEDISSGILGDLSPPPAVAPVEEIRRADEEEEEEEEGLPEPKTPEARPKALPSDDDVGLAPSTASPSQEPSTASPSESPAEAKPRQSKDLSLSESIPAPPPQADKPKPAPPPKLQSTKAPALRPPRRKERSGVLALDQYLSDGPDEAEVTERDEDDDDWDFIEADGGEDRNGAKGTSLFARGVVDRYRLAVFRKASTPSRSGTMSRSVSGMSKASASEGGATATPEASPSPSIRRGRNPGSGLTFRKTPRQFLRPKSPAPPPSSFSGKSGKSMNQSTSVAMTPSSSSSGGMLTSVTSTTGGSGSAISASSPSLKSKESAVSVGAQSYSSDTSANGDRDAAPPDHLVEEPEKQKNKKLKKYKENAEKVFSIFSNSPRQPSHLS